MTDTDTPAAQVPLNGTVPAPEPNDIDRVRDVLFGSHAREFDRRFRTNERRIDELSTVVQRLTDRLEHEISEMQSAIRQQHIQTMMRVEDVNRVGQERLQAQQREMG